jgi:hypothetical protein
MTVYKVQGDLPWVKPMLVFVQVVNGDDMVVAQQQNPDNGATYQPLEDHQCYPFSVGDWQSCEKC